MMMVPVTNSTKVEQPVNAEVEVSGEPTESRSLLRATMVVNPYASRLTAQRERAITRILSPHVQLDVQRTQRAHHATEIVRDALAADTELIIACGGDGTANEVVNGLDPQPHEADKLPFVAVIPAGGTNVLARVFGLPNNPARAARQLVESIRGRRSSTINLARFDERVFLFSAGAGVDAEVLQRIGMRRRGRRPSDIAHVAATVSIFAAERFALEDRLTVSIAETGETLRAAMLMCSHTDPATYMGRLPLRTTPEASLLGGLDFIAPHRLNAATALRMAGVMLGTVPNRLGNADAMQRHHDVDTITVVADDPISAQVDGEYVGERTHMTMRTVPRALRMIY